MKIKHHFFAFLVFFLPTFNQLIFADPNQTISEKIHVPPSRTFVNYVNQEDFTTYADDPEALKKFLLPNNHPLQAKLKKIFSDSSILDSDEKAKKAGFHVIKVRREINYSKKSGFIVLTHPSIKGYLFKTFLNAIPAKTQLEEHLKRIQGIKIVEDYIKKYDLKYIVAPKKWLYALPSDFSDPNTEEQVYILVVEWLDLHDKQETIERYKNISKKKLTELCKILFDIRGLDGTFNNLPFTKSKQIAFIDTEHWNWEDRGLLRKIMDVLPPDSQDYVNRLWEKHQRKKAEE